MIKLFFCAVTVVALFFIFLLLNKYLNLWNDESLSDKTKKKNAEQKKGGFVNCPLCQSSLLPGEDLFSRVYRPMNVPDQLCTISGCPHCYPIPEPGIQRICPVCHKSLDVKDGHLVARLFNKTEGKKHVIVTGCNHCCRGSI